MSIKSSTYTLSFDNFFTTLYNYCTCFLGKETTKPNRLYIKGFQYYYE